MNMSVKSFSRTTLPNLNLNTSASKPSKEIRPTVDIKNRHATQDSAKEEISIAVASKMADEKKPVDSKKLRSSNLLKKVTHIENINSIINKLNLDNKVRNISKEINNSIQLSENKFIGFISDKLNESEEPASIFLSLKKIQHSSNLNNSQKKIIESISNNIISDDAYLTSIKTSDNIAEIANNYFKDPDMASSFRMLVGQGNASMADPATIISTLLQAGNERNYDILMNAYTDSLAKESLLKPPIPSTHLEYLRETFQSLNNQLSTKSLLKDSNKYCNILEKKLNLERINRAEFAKDLIDFTKSINHNECQISIDLFSKKYGSFGKNRLLTVANQARKMLDSLALAIWNGDSEKRFNSINQMDIYIDSHSKHKKFSLSLNENIRNFT